MRHRARLAPCFAVAALATLPACAEPPPAAAPPPRSPLAAVPAPAPAPPVASAAPPASAPLPEGPDHARALHAAAIVVDTHNDIPSKIIDTGFDLGKPDGKTHTDLPRMKSGGVTAEFFSIYVDADYVKSGAPGGGPARRALDLIDVTYQQIERHPNELRLATSVDDIRAAKRDGKVAVLMGIEGGHAIEDSLFALREFYRLGVRYMTLTHTNTNDWADSSGGFGRAPDARHHGLSPFGEEVVREMQRIGMLVDVSHVSDETVDDVLRIARAPIIASHSSSRALAAHSRNLTDDQLRAIGKNGGVVMVNFFVGFLDGARAAADAALFKDHAAEIKALRARFKDDPDKLSAAMAKLRKAPVGPTPLAVLIDHIDHVAKVAGVDHVGLGSDFDGVSELPQGMTGIGDLPRITEELLKRGYSDDDVKKVLGENLLRAMSAAEAYARSTKTTLSGDGSTRRITDK